jgi:hypothetical protein
MKQCTFAELKNFDDNNSSVMLGITPNCTVDQVDSFFHETGFLNEDQHVIELFHISDNVKGEDGRSDILVVHSGGNSGNPIARLRMCRSGFSLKWTSDFIVNCAKDYISEI